MSRCRHPSFADARRLIPSLHRASLTLLSKKPFVIVTSQSVLREWICGQVGHEESVLRIVDSTGNQCCENENQSVDVDVRDGNPVGVGRRSHSHLANLDAHMGRYIEMAGW